MIIEKITGNKNVAKVLKVLMPSIPEEHGSNKTRAFVYIAYAYILLPFLIFAIGWFGKRYWVPIVPVLLFCFWKAGRETPALWIPELNRDNIVKILFIILMVFIWVYFSGIGKMVFQNQDHGVRNSVFEILVQQDWPIYNYDVIIENFKEGTTGTSLIYYIGFWIPAAVFGKIFGIDAGYGFQAFWAILGIVLIYYFICARKERLLVWPLAIMIFFSGLDIIGQYFRGVDLFTLSNDTHLEWWGEPYQYSSMTTQLFWVFNQSIPAWLCTILAFIQKNNKSLVFILACCMLPSTFPFVGLLVLAVYWAFSRKYDLSSGSSRKERAILYAKEFFSDTFTLQNIAGGGIIGIFSFLYLNANVSGNRVMQETLYGPSFDNHLIKYLLFILLEVGIYFVVLYKYNKEKSMYYVLLICLLIIPPIKIGAGGDFCMRASIPALFMLMIMVIDALDKAKKSRDLAVVISLSIILCIGAVTPFHEIVRTFKNTVNSLNSEEQVYLPSIDNHTILNSPNFSGAIDDSFFFKYIAR